MLIREDVFRCVSIPTAILSTPAASKVSERRKTRVAIPAPGLIIIARDKAIAITPNTICKILTAFEFFFNRFRS